MAQSDIRQAVRGLRDEPLPHLDRAEVQLYALLAEIDAVFLSDQARTEEHACHPQVRAAAPDAPLDPETARQSRQDVARLRSLEAALREAAALSEQLFTLLSRL